MKAEILLTLLLWSGGTLLSAQDLLETSRIVDGYRRADMEDESEAQELDPEEIIPEDILSPGFFDPGLLSTAQKLALIAYQERFGPLLSIYELLYVDGFSAGDIDRINPGSHQEEGSPHIAQIRNPHHWKQKLIVAAGRRLERSDGYQTGPSGASYEGLRDKILLKYDIRKGERFRGALVMEKDAGESMRSPDFTGGFATYRMNGVVREILLGDFLLHFGTGLTLSQKRSFPGGPGKVFNAMNPSSGKFSPEEMQYMRGLAMTIQVGSFRVIPFLSCKKIDGIIEEEVITGLPSSGLHRTVNEINNRRTVKETMGGLNLTYSAPSVEVGFTSFYLLYDRVVDLRNKPYQKFNFSGRGLSAFGFFFRAGKGGFRPFAELALGPGKGRAILGGIGIYPGPATVLAASFYKSNLSFNNKLSNPSLWGDGPGREGIYLGLSAELLPYLRSCVSAIMEKRTWIGYLSDQPVAGLETSVELQWDSREAVDLLLRYRMSIRRKNQATDFEFLRSAAETIHHELKVKMLLKLSPELEMTVESGLVKIRKAMGHAETGSLVAVDLHYRPVALPLRLSVRTGQFETGGFDSRIYSYERDAPHSMSIPAYSGRGTRVVVLLQYELNETFRFYLRCGVFHYPDQHELGTGSDRIDGNRKTDLKIMFMCNF